MALRASANLRLARTMTLIGRSDERAGIARLLDGARAGRSGVLVVRGEAGVGKTALLEDAIESAPDLRVVRASGVESEMELPSRRCTSCARCWSTGWIGCPDRSAMRFGRRSE